MPSPGTESPPSPLSYVELLELRAGEQPQDLAYAFLSEGEETERATFGELDLRARAVAARLAERGAAGERVLLLFPPGLDYIAAFFGCLYAGAVAVPAYPPRMNRNLGRLLAIVADARPRLVLTTAALLGQSDAWRREAPGLAEPVWLATDRPDAGDGAGFRPPAVAPDDLAFLQYTSGSTGNPKGVMVSHRNLLHNQRMMAESLGHGPDTVIVSWLPLYHDMGLIGNVLTSAYHGGPCYVMAPVDFLKSPVRWLEAIGRYRATFSGGPDFGYARCVERVTPEEIERLDLSSWKAAFNGSEPVRADTLERFAATFARCGFRREALFPCFGLAEATLFVAGRFTTRPETAWSRAGLAAGRAVPAAPAEEADVLVSCGTTSGGSRLAIADRETGRELPEGAVGEIWLAGDSVARGYWGRSEATAATFAARLEPAGGESGRPEGWLRTGDLGFVVGGELHVNGRLKDLIVLRGRNFHPHDLERLVEESHPALRPGYSAAFSVEAAGAERLVLVAEVRRERRRGLDAAEVIGRVRAAVRAEHAVDPAAVTLLRPGGLPKTSSGKTQRAVARAAFLAGELEAVGAWRSRAAEEAAPSPPTPPDLGAAEIERWLAGQLATRLELPEGTIDRERPIASYGLDSVVAVDLIRSIEDRLGTPFPIERLFVGTPSLADLARQLAGRRTAPGDRGESASDEVAGGEPAPAAAPPPAPGGERTAPAAPAAAPVPRPRDAEAHPFRRFVNPELGRLLAQLGADRAYVRGEGCWLWDREGRRVLDFLAQYGALPFGFNPPRIWAALEAVRSAAEPSLVQPSYLEAAGELAERLIALAPPGMARVTFANSGAEAVEAAIKLARSTTGRMGVLAARNGFHGKTLGALSATDKRKYQQPFGAPVPGFHHVPYGDAEALAEALADRGYAAFLVEPIQGEGGIVDPPVGYLREARELCKRAGTLLVVDEVQTGLGRTGSLFACEVEGVTPDVLTLAKALGGGLLPIGACLATAAACNEDFALNHTSTFAGNALACRAGLATLELLTENDRALVRGVARHGARLKRELGELQRRYPDLIRQVSGRGYMLGVQFGLDRASGGGGILGWLGESEALTALVVGHLLRFEGIRVGFTLNRGGVLRIEPPLVAGWEECRAFLDGFERLLGRLETRDAAVLTAHLTGIDPAAVAPAPAPRPRPRLRPPAGAGRFAFLVHPLELGDYRDLEPSLGALSEEQIRTVASCLADNFDPFPVGETVVASATGGSAYGEFVLVPRRAEELLRLPYPVTQAEVRSAAEVARARGARIIGLGAFLSVVTHGGLSLAGDGLPALTTGNAYTAVAGCQALALAAAGRGIELAASTAAVLGAAGSVGRAVALRLAGEVGRLVLLGNPRSRASSRRRLAEIAREIVAGAWERHRRGEVPDPGSVAAAAVQFGPPPPRVPAAEHADRFLRASGAIRISTDAPRRLPAADLVVTCTSAVSRLVTPQTLKRGAVVCDISRPTNVDPAVRSSRPDVTVIDGGVVRLPGGGPLGLSTDLGPGLAYACMAETMMLALEQRYVSSSLGVNLSLDQLRDMEELARRHGFEPVVSRCPPSIDRDAPPQSGGERGATPRGGSTASSPPPDGGGR